MSKDFNGTSDLINCGSPSLFDGLLELSIAAWIRADTFGENANGRIVQKSGLNTVGDGWRLFVRGTANDNNMAMIVPFSTTSLVRRSALGTVVTSVWQHWVCTWDGTVNATGIRFYLNGTETGYTAPTSGVGTRVNDSANPVIIGNSDDQVRTFDGLMGHVCLYDGELTPGEVSMLYHFGTNAHTMKFLVNLIGYWQMNESAAATALDLSGNGNNGTVTGTSVAEEPPARVRRPGIFRHTVRRPVSIGPRINSLALVGIGR